MTDILARWNQVSAEAAAKEILACCGSMTWARELASRRPFDDTAPLIAASDEIWNRLAPQHWLEAFAKHPRIGVQGVPQTASARSAAWSAQEQQSLASAEDAVRSALMQSNQEYERRFGRVFIVCATGKSAAEMLGILRRRMLNDDAAELREAAEEQRNITNIRLKKWLNA